MTVETSVLYVCRQDAKAVKSCLDRASLLDKRFRMTPVVNNNDTDAIIHSPMFVKCSNVRENGGFSAEAKYEDSSRDRGNLIDDAKNCIAVPVTTGCVDQLHQYYQGTSQKNDNDSLAGCNYMLNRPEVCRSLKEDDLLWLSERIVGLGRYICPFSTSMLGNNNKNRRTVAVAAPVYTRKKNNKFLFTHNDTFHVNDGSSKALNRSFVAENIYSPLTNVQYALIDTLSAWLDNETTHENEALTRDTVTIEKLVRGLSVQTCPKKFEVIGDDRTLVVPRWSFFINSQKRCTAPREKAKDDVSYNGATPKRGTIEFRDFLVRIIRRNKEDNKEGQHVPNSIEQGEPQTDEYLTMHEMQLQLWKNLSDIYNSPRVVRRGDIDPESDVRESGHRILWPIPPLHESTTISGDCDRGFLPKLTGPDSPGWVTVTEHRVRQSFDLTRVMFSRGNVTEKNRFGSSLVQPGECVLDMYAGIGYYTLPALIHGKARHVTACEWNAHALGALRYNLKVNGVEDKATVLEGDCRVSLKAHIAKPSTGDEENVSTTINNQFDRISLGLLPSSEGGWSTAISCLRRSTGGWLHVHGNVPTIERQYWAHWICRSLARIAAEKRHGAINYNDWVAVCTHVEKVKSFAPKVDHVVADIFVGPRDSPKTPLKGDSCLTTGVVDSSGKFVATIFDNVSPPSCALGKEGIIHQNWLRESS